MKLAVFAFTRQGCRTAREAARALNPQQCRRFAPEKFGQTDFEAYAPPLADFMAPVFSWADAILFVGSTGMALRAIAPWVRDKKTDPAVLVVDEGAHFVIPLLSGHIGGANALAARLAEALGAAAAVTTATDVNGRFSVDAWAAARGLHIDDMKAAKAVSAAILEGPVPLCSDFPVVGELPPGVTAGEAGPVGICVSCWRKRPFAATLLLVPRAVRLGIGCRRGTPAADIRALVDETLAAHQIHPAAVKAVGSIDLKQDEPGLLAYCREQGWPVEFYTASRLEAVEGEFTPSDFVRRTTGVDNVCERAAALGGGELVIRKTSGHGVTVAAAVEEYEVRFDG